MSTHIEWPDIVLRLLCALLTGALLGSNRGRHGRPAGLRTTMLVAVASCMAMVQANLLLPMVGKAPTSFVQLDVMRLPLGILSGIGFIGAGAIVRRDNFVTGVTTASTLWFVTVLGLAYGGGQFLLGILGTALGFFILSGLKRIEHRWLEERRGTLVVHSRMDSQSESLLRSQLLEDGFHIKQIGVTYSVESQMKELRLDLRWRTRGHGVDPPAAIASIAAEPGVVKIRWSPEPV